MLTAYSPRYGQHTHSKQKGVVLLITLIMLVAMTLAAIALMRSVDTTNLVAGNLAFQQASVDTADIGTEQGIAYLYTVPNINCDGTIPTDPCPVGYKSFHQPNVEPPYQSWESFWNTIKNSTGVVALTSTPTGYSGEFVIEAMCTTPKQGKSTPPGTCDSAGTSTTVTSSQGQNMGSNTDSHQSSTATLYMHYYRITTRVVGPRNSVGYVQALIGL